MADEHETQTDLSAALHQSEQHYRSLFDEAPFAYQSLDEDGHFIAVNKTWCELLGYAPEEVLGRSFGEIIHRDLQGHFTRSFPEFKALGSILGVEYEMIRRDGSALAVAINGKIAHHEDGSFKQTHCVLEDISKRKEAETAATVSREQYRELFDNMAEGVALFEAVDDGEDFVFVDYNRAGQAMDGVRRPRASARRVTEVFPGVAKLGLLEVLRRVWRCGEPEGLPVSRYQDDKQSFHRKNYVYKLPNRMIVAVYSDESKRIETEKKRREISDRYQLLAQNATDVIWTADMNLRMEFVSPSIFHLRGYTYHEVLAQPLSDMMTPESLIDALALLARQMELVEAGDEAGWDPVIFQAEQLCKDGTTVITSSHVTLIAGPDGQPKLVLGVTHDITERKRDEDVRRRQQQAISVTRDVAQIFLTAPPQGVFGDVLDVLRETLASPYGYFGYIDAAGDLVSPSLTRDIWDECQVPDKTIAFPRGTWTGLWGRSLTEKRTLLANAGLQLPAGHVPITSALAVPIVHQGELVGQIVLGNKPGGYDENDQALLESVAAQIAPILHARRENEQRKAAHGKLELQFQQSQKLESIGRLAGGVAHDFNNLLTVINSYARFAVDDLRDDDPLRADMRLVLEAGERAAVLTRQLLAFSRKQLLNPQVLSLNQVVRTLEKMLGRILGEDITLSTALADDLGAANADPGQLDQVLMNLAVNARDAMPRGGKLIIETTNVELGEAEAEAKAELNLSAGRYVMVAMTDVGTGITDDVRAHIFEPFFTTKEVGAGTGLGLSTVYGIVTQSGGGIAVHSRPGQGTTFRIYLPRVDVTAAPAPPIPLASPALGKELILVVEDEVAVRKLTRRILEKADYVVLCASSGREALATYERQGEAIHLVLTDVVMPEMSGEELVGRLHKASPRLKVLFMSGYPDNAIAPHCVIDDCTHFLAKPFNPAELLAKVRAVLDSD